MHLLECTCPGPHQQYQRTDQEFLLLTVPHIQYVGRVRLLNQPTAEHNHIILQLTNYVKG
jgi:hypothetical protein